MMYDKLPKRYHRQANAMYAARMLKLFERVQPKGFPFKWGSTLDKTTAYALQYGASWLKIAAMRKEHRTRL